MITHSVDTRIRVPRGDSGHIRGQGGQVLVALSELQDAARQALVALDPPQGAEATLTISLGATDVLITASYTGDQ